MNYRTAFRTPRRLRALLERIGRARGVFARHVDTTQSPTSRLDRAHQIERLRGIIQVGPGDVVADVRRARRRTGTAAGA